MANTLINITDDSNVNISDIMNNFYYLDSNIDDLNNAKVDKDGSKVLSDNNFSNSYKSMLDQVPSGQSILSTANKGVANGVVPLNGSALIDSIFLPSYVDDVVEGYLYSGYFYKDSSHTQIITGESGKIYINLSNDELYRYSGSSYVKILSMDIVPLTNDEIDAAIALA